MPRIPKKYELTADFKVFHGITVYRIRNLSNGLLGGWVQSEANLSQLGGCWVAGDAIVCSNATVCEDAIVEGRAIVLGQALIQGAAIVSERANIRGRAEISWDARVFGDAVVYGDARIIERACVSGAALVHSNAVVRGSAIVRGNCVVRGHAEIEGTFDGDTGCYEDGQHFMSHAQAAQQRAAAQRAAEAARVQDRAAYVAHPTRADAEAAIRAAIESVVFDGDDDDEPITPPRPAVIRDAHGRAYILVDGILQPYPEADPPAPPTARPPGGRGFDL